MLVRGADMKRRIIRVGLLIVIMTLLMPVVSSAQSERTGLLLELEGVLTSAMEEYLNRGLTLAESRDVDLIIIRLDTPGGEVGLLLDMVQSIRASRIPVVVYVAPQGAIAASAGTVITLAGHAAAMAPETVIGAASPVGGQGEDLNETLETKAKELLMANVRSLTERRSQEAVQLAQQMIEEATAVSANEALEAGLIDFVAEDLDDLLNQLDGFEVETVVGPVTIETQGMEIETLSPSFIESLLQILTDPNIVFLFITIGVQPILIEISAPGGWVAGFIGVVSLSLAIYGLGILPVNWFGLIFLVTAFVLFLLEVKAPTHGALTVAGLASFIVGALVLFNSAGTPDFLQVSVPLVVGTGLVTAAVFITLVAYAVRAQLRPVETGAEALIGRHGRARTALDPGGTIHVTGELWSSILSSNSQPVEADDEVEVVSVEGLRLVVRKVQPSSES
jgi:membrane-bound serine protease (ClpP class)